ncbi:unnamed protein product [Mytilus edulis]|uniref:Uncharacterized protein n=1 Tax=Mytilus edulis TaxID=6550 RepID=A0A8S3UCW4_MYTED|nr:unnamed protein product [Mytilus edulis]
MCQPKPNEESLGKVNMSLYWNKVENSIVTDGITKGKTFLSSIFPTYDNWAPWIGASSRLNEYAYNTEYMKCQHNSDTDAEPVPDEVLKNLRDEKKSTVKRFCRELGIKPGNGSVLDLILKMRRIQSDKVNTTKSMRRFFGTTGGWVIGLCPHSVVYASKCLLRGESPRDFVDLLRSFKHQPNVVIVDVANKVASCGNRLRPVLFHPHERIVAGATEENVRRAEGVLFSLPFLQETQDEVNESCNTTTDS